MTVTIYQTYPPIQGIVMAELDLSWNGPIWADETTSVVATGRVLRKFERRGRRYVQWEAYFSREGGEQFATLNNTFHVPE
jgi:acyl-coenzyme A thioesterase PaaI-like protein